MNVTVPFDVDPGTNYSVVRTCILSFAYASAVDNDLDFVDFRSVRRLGKQEPDVRHLKLNNFYTPRGTSPRHRYTYTDT